MAWTSRWRGDRSDSTDIGHFIATPLVTRNSDFSLSSQHQTEFRNLFLVSEFCFFDLPTGISKTFRGNVSLRKPGIPTKLRSIPTFPNKLGITFSSEIVIPKYFLFGPETLRVCIQVDCTRGQHSSFIHECNGLNWPAGNALCIADMPGHPPPPSPHCSCTFGTYKTQSSADRSMHCKRFLLLALP